MATEIRTGTSLVTLCNVFETTADTQTRLIEILTKATQDAMSRRPGFVSANFHASRDGLRVVNYAQWESMEAFDAMLADPECKLHMRQAETLVGKDPDVHIYDVIATHAPA
jgi:quinol monooxygenase YgiN